MLHVLNGDSARMTMERSGLPGEFLVWADILYEGPTPLALGDEWVRTRAAHLEGLEGGWHLYAKGASHLSPLSRDILSEYTRNNARLESSANDDDVVFWFEHDLFDQLLLIRHLWWMGARGARATFSLVCVDRYLGLLPPDAFPPLFEARRPITAAQVALGSRAWEAFCGPDPTALLSFTTAVSPELPFLAGALLRYLQEFPSSANGLTRTETEILRTLRDGPQAPDVVFRSVTAREERIFLGDSSFWTIVERLAYAYAPHPLVALDIQPRAGRLPQGLMHLTPAGEAVLAGRADHIALNGIDRWMGGVHLTPDCVWRWTGALLSGTTVASAQPEVPHMADDDRPMDEEGTDITAGGGNPEDEVGPAGAESSRSTGSPSRAGRSTSRSTRARSAKGGSRKGGSGRGGSRAAGRGSSAKRSSSGKSRSGSRAGGGKGAKKGSKKGGSRGGSKKR